MGVQPLTLALFFYNLKYHHTDVVLRLDMQKHSVDVMFY